MILIITITLLVIQVNAQLVFHNAKDYPLLGKISPDTETRYERLPGYLKDVTRPPVWRLGKNTAGLALRFRSNSTQIAARWELLYDKVMNHMAFTGIKGLDLYAIENGKWEYVKTARPTGKINEFVIISNMESKMREYMLYLPLYDGVLKLEIGIDSLSIISQPEINLPDRDKPIIYYGASGAQGACASRPGMVHTSILSRWLNKEFINLGFSGQNKLDFEIAELISTRDDASVIVLDCLSNNTSQEVVEKLGKFYQIIRNKLPDVPIIFIDLGRSFNSPIFDLKSYNSVREHNEALDKVFNSLIKSGEQNIIRIHSQGAKGTDGEGTVDGGHSSNLGFMRYAEFLLPIIDYYDDY